MIYPELSLWLVLSSHCLIAQNGLLLKHTFQPQRKHPCPCMPENAYWKCLIRVEEVCLRLLFTTDNISPAKVKWWEQCTLLLEHDPISIEDQTLRQPLLCDATSLSQVLGTGDLPDQSLHLWKIDSYTSSIPESWYVIPMDQQPSQK